MKKYENKKASFNANYDKTVNQLVRRFPEVVNVVSDLSGHSIQGKMTSMMGNLATIDAYANKHAFATVDSFRHVKNGFAQNLRLAWGLN